MIPPNGYTIRYHGLGFNGTRRALDGRPACELPHQFLIYKPDRKNWTFNLGFRLSIEAGEDELPKLMRETDEDTAEWTILRWAVRKVEQRLREGPIDSPISWLQLELEDFELLRQMVRQKNCDYQVKMSRDLFCSASFAGDPGRSATVGLKTFAWTSPHHCQACLMPDSEFLCSHLSHAEVELKEPLGQRSPRRAVCAKNQPNIDEPALCYPSGHECWEWIIVPRAEDSPALYASPALTQALDLLDAIWRLRFGKERGLVRLPSATSIASLERDCSTHEEFLTRLIALADVFGAIDIADTLVSREQITGSLNRLEAVLQTHLPEDSERESALASVHLLRAANALRRLRPMEAGRPESTEYVRSKR